MGNDDTRLALLGTDRGTPEYDTRSRSTPPRKERGVLEFLSLIVRRKWLVLTIVVIMTSPVALYTLSQPLIYEASATLQLDSKEYVFMEDSRGSILRAYSNDEYQRTQVSLLSNPHLMRQVILKLDLEHNPTFLRGPENSGPVSRVRSSLWPKKATQASQPTPPRVVESDVNDLTQGRISQLEPYVARLLAGLKIQPYDKTSLVVVSMTHSDPQLAKDIVNALTNIFVNNTDKYETKASREAAEILSRQLTDLQTKIKQGEEDRLNYLKSHNLPLEKGDGRNLTADRLSKLSSQLLDAENERKSFEALYDAAKKAPKVSALPLANEGESVNDLRKAIAELKRKRVALTQIYTPEWGEVKKVDAEIRQLEADLAKASDESIDSLEWKLNAAASREAKLRAAYYAERGAANAQTQDELALANLNQQIETNREVYNMLLRRHTEMQVDSLDKTGHIGIVSPAVAPSAPIGPARLSKILTALLGSLLGAIALVFVLDLFDNTLKSAGDVTYYTGLPTLALIPAVNGINRLSLKEKILFRFRRSQPAGTPLALTEDIRSPSAEAYRHLRASLAFTPSGQSPRTILVTSGSPFEGKTTTAINLAITLAQGGENVLLIDCDLRRPRLHTHFNLANAHGLTDYLSGKHDFDALIETHAAIPKLKIIPAGPTPANPADSLGSVKMRVTLQVLEKMFDHIIIDSPPASSLADASVLSTAVDGVVLVVDSRRSSRNMLKRVHERLEAVGANVNGVVLNYANLATDEYYSGYYNSYE